MLLLQTASKAQGNLQFNRVVSYTGTVPNNTNFIIDTVKQGKVIKLESTGLSGPSTIFNIGRLQINGKEYVNMVGGTSMGVSVHEILWLKEGDVISYKNINSAGNIDYVITGIEYNIIP